MYSQVSHQKTLFTMKIVKWTVVVHLDEERLKKVSIFVEKCMNETNMKNFFLIESRILLVLRLIIRNSLKMIILTDIIKSVNCALS